MDHEPEIRLRVESRVIRVLNPRRSNFIAENGESFFAIGMFWVVFGAQFFGVTNWTIATAISSLCLSVILARRFGYPSPLVRVATTTGAILLPGPASFH